MRKYGTQGSEQEEVVDSCNWEENRVRARCRKKAGCSSGAGHSTGPTEIDMYGNQFKMQKGLRGDLGPGEAPIIYRSPVNTSELTQRNEEQQAG